MVILLKSSLLDIAKDLNISLAVVFDAHLPMGEPIPENHRGLQLFTQQEVGSRNAFSHEFAAIENQ